MELVSSLGRREQNKIVNRKRILKAGLDVFSTIGYEASTITDIVKASGLSVGTFYNYYGDKDSVFAELINDLIADSREALAEARFAATSIEEFILGAFQAYGELLNNYPAMQRLIAKNGHAFRQFVFGSGDMGGVIADLEHDMRQSIEQGLLPPFDVRLMTSAMIGAGLEVFAFDDCSDPMTPSQKAEFLGQLFLGGIARLSTNH